MSASVLAAGPDLRLSSKDYAAVSEFLHRRCGIRMREGKEALVVSRLGHRVRALRLPTLTSYINAVLDEELSGELPNFIDVLTTNKTGFYRESRHFDYLAAEILPQLVKRGREIKMWSAACSSGEEPYTLAITVRETIPPEFQHRVRILATDISTRIITAAKAGRYTGQQAQGIPKEQLKRWFTAQGDETFEAKAQLKELVRFAQLNLMEAWPMRGPFDVIMCRNVMIYFDRETQERLVRRFAELLPPGGVLCVGHAESLNGLSHGLEQMQPAVYRKAG